VLTFFHQGARTAQYFFVDWPNYAGVTMRRSKTTDQPDFGCKGGASAIAGKKSRKISATIMGVVYTKRVFFDQQYLVVSINKDKIIVTAWSKEAQATSQRDYALRDGVMSDYALAQTV
jgi:uncharacterized membrane protein (Fun14 family)